MALNLKSFFMGHEEEVAQIGVVGLYLGPNKIYAIQLVPDEEDNIKVMFMASAEARSMEEREVALKKIVEQHDLVGQRTCIVLGQNEYKLTMIDTPPDIDEDDIQGSIAEYVEDYLDYKIDNTSTDIFHIPFPRANDGKNVSFLVSADMELVKRYEQIILKTGLSLEAIDIPELCYRNVISLDQQLNNQEKGYVMLNLYQSGGNAFIYHKDNLLMSRNISPKIGIDLSHFLLTNESIISEQEYDETLTSLSTYIQRTVDYCNGVFKEAQIDKLIYLPSDIVNVEAIKSFVDQHLGLTSFTFNIENLLTIPDEYKKLDVVNFFPAIGVALGNLKEKSHAED